MPDVKPNELPEEDKRNFAREQFEFLKTKGIRDRRRLSRIFKAAGPGQVKQAWELANCEDWGEDEEAKVRRDTLDCILAGATGVKFGWKRMADLIDYNDFPVPEAFNGKQFFRILSGAREILDPGSYNFTNKELQEIEDGLNRFSTRENGGEEQEEKERK